MASFKALPKEIIYQILERLLPRVTRSDLDEEYVLEQTRDLFHARAVCKGLHDLATPLAWRRLRLRIRAIHLQGQGNLTSAPNSQLFSSFAAPGVGGSYPSRAQAGHPVRPNPLNPYIPFILDHRDLVLNTRFLILDLPEWDSDNYALSQCAERIAGSLGSFESLRVLFVHYRTQHAPPTFFSAFMRLRQQDLSLHISQCETDPGGPPPPISSVKYLQFTESIGMFPAIAQARSLTHLWLERCQDHHSAASQLPWHSLISVGLRDCPSQFWGPFFTGFSVSALASFLPRPKRSKLSAIVSEMRVGGDIEAYSRFFLTLAGVPASRKYRAIDRIEYRKSPHSAFPSTCLHDSGDFRVSGPD